MSDRRAFVIVLDACGAGELPDSAEYGDAGANTLGHVAEAAGGLDLPVLESLGLGNIMPIAGVTPAHEPVVHGRLHPLGPGKDTVNGHWELMGVVAPAPQASITITKARLLTGRDSGSREERGAR